MRDYTAVYNCRVNDMQVFSFSFQIYVTIYEMRVIHVCKYYELIGIGF